MRSLAVRDAVFLGQRAQSSFHSFAKHTHTHVESERADKAQLMVTQISTQFNEIMLNYAAKSPRTKDSLFLYWFILDVRIV